MTYAVAISRNGTSADTMFGFLSKSEIELAEIKAREAANRSRVENYPARQARLVNVVQNGGAASRPQMHHGSTPSTNDPKPTG